MLARMFENSLEEELLTGLFSLRPFADCIEDKFARLTRLGPCWSVLRVEEGNTGSGVQEEEGVGEVRVCAGLAESPGVSDPVRTSGLKGDLWWVSQGGERGVKGLSCDEEECGEKDCTAA